MTNLQKLAQCVKPLFDNEGTNLKIRLNPELLDFEDKFRSEVEIFFIKADDGSIVDTDKPDGKNPYVRIKGNRTIKNNRIWIRTETSFNYGENKLADNEFIHESKMKKTVRSMFRKVIKEGEPFYVELDDEGYYIVNNLLNDLDIRITERGKNFVLDIENSKLTVTDLNFNFDSLNEWFKYVIVNHAGPATKYRVIYYLLKNGEIVTNIPSDAEVEREYHFSCCPDFTHSNLEISVYDVINNYKSLVMNEYKFF